MPIPPYLLLDEKVMLQNLNRMREKATASDCTFRPHFKTHQSRKIGSKLRGLGVQGITVSSVTMAAYFAEDGWNDITIAFPVLLHQLDMYKALSEQCSLNVLIQSEEIIHELNKRLDFNIGVYIELDPDYGRSGVSYTEYTVIENLIRLIRNSKHLKLQGLYCHAGNSYKCKSPAEITSFGMNVMAKLHELKKQFPDCKICYGDTPTCSVLDDLSTADELSPGNFIFYDLMQVGIGSCNEEDIAVRVVVPVAEKRPNNTLIIHGGAVHFSKESLLMDNRPVFGKVKDSEASYLISLSQEHGIVQCDEALYRNTKRGDMLEILPVHSCLTADLMGEFYNTDGDRIDHMRRHRFSL